MRFSGKTTGAGIAALMAATAMTPALAAAPIGSGFADLVETVSPAVVYVEVTTKAETSADANTPQMDPRFEEFMKRFGDQMPQMPKGSTPSQGLGSGFIISEDGLIVTNHHVIANAETVSVTLADGTEIDAQVIGSDPLTDIALIDIEGDGYDAVTFGSSDSMRVGEEVIAVGSPFGLEATVTSGIISAKSRNINSGPFDDYIQTDAAVNRGNSGGPLFNMQGEVVGVNTAIFSPDGGSVGIGFAVPSDLVTEIVADLKEDGEIERSWLGVQIKPVSDEISHVLGLKSGEGVMIAEVFEDSPAQASGLETGDVILKFGDKDIEELRDLTKVVATSEAGEISQIEIFRGGQSMTLDVTLEKRGDQKT
ncbi:putative periplasmic serine endoprotease DegP-like precursor [Roseovarius albus]|uniref:Probable periplasmic serine endoprotease DegP-like n=1 Tax=Roseovarius albus TaxID=1247867 RepID=A0A1X6Y6P1_9RHOB|nr:Do family serine endopeptidase [Roseovarius albus]SLN11595.1 putative periplasmic serine endoprotease DegP-like precursor [Roseovarius albus]